MMHELQSQAVGTPWTDTFWCGTESGHPSADMGPSDIWSTTNSSEMIDWNTETAKNCGENQLCYHGSPNGDVWLPKFCDPQLFTQTSQWFWSPDLEIRTLADMLPIYQDIVGRGMTMELGERAKRALRKTSLLAMKPAKWLQT